MTEHEWLNTTSRSELLQHFYRSSVSERKRRLFACACCRLIWDLLVDERSRKAIEVTERYADGEVTSDQIEHAREASVAVSSVSRGRLKEAARIAFKAAFDYPLGSIVYGIERVAQYENVDRVQYGLIREVLGNPFRPVTIEPTWLTSNVVALANAIYQERLFEQLPILADALQDEGCEHEELLAHLLGSGPHVRGCWALDLILGKS
jgi:hypothetical protein